MLSVFDLIGKAEGLYWLCLYLDCVFEPDKFVLPFLIIVVEELIWKLETFLIYKDDLK